MELLGGITYLTIHTYGVAIRDCGGGEQTDNGDKQLMGTITLPHRRLDERKDCILRKPEFWNLLGIVFGKVRLGLSIQSRFSTPVKRSIRLLMVILLFESMRMCMISPQDSQA